MTKTQRRPECRGRYDQSLIAACLSALMVFLAILAAPGQAAGADKVMIVLDASGSMWGRIDGRPKIEIARQVLDEVLTGAPRELSIGLIAYGHRRKGSCTDIELLAEPAPAAAGAIASKAAELSPKGKTPITAAVRQAAEALRYTEEKATVILITDGLETCKADPCALAAELERSGVDFTTHVVGFGLSAKEGRQISCLAELTGGSYFPADGAATLAGALRISVSSPFDFSREPVEAVGLPAGALEGPAEVEIGRPFDVSWQGPGGAFDRIQLVDPRANNGRGRDVFSLRVSDGNFENHLVTLIAPVVPGLYELRYVYGDAYTVIATSQITVINAPASLDAPPNVGLGQEFVVAWEGPGDKLDRVEIVDPALDGTNLPALRAVRLANGDLDAQTVKLVAPAEPGFYRLRYWHNPHRVVLARREIEVLDAEVSVSAPDAVPMGQTFAIEWVGPGARLDAVEIFDELHGSRGRVVSSKRLVLGDFDNRRVELNAPAEPGSYLLRYWNGDNREVLAVRPIVVKPIEVSLSAPESALVAEAIDIEWTGPGARLDAVQVFDPAADAGKGRVLATKRLVNGDYEKRLVRIKTPERPGSYQLRYWNGDSRLVLAVRPLIIR